MSQVDAIKDWIEEILGGPTWPDPAMHRDVAYYTKHHWPERLKSIECAAEVCAFIKCLEDDKRCPNPPARVNKKATQQSQPPKS
jgi:hypothetical protein